MIRWASPQPEPRMTKREIAEDRGFDPGENYHLPPAQHLNPPAGVNPLAWFIHSTRSLRIVGPLTRCAHPFCRTSVTEDDVSFCPHNLPFCEGCAWPEGCDDCANSIPDYDREAS